MIRKPNADNGTMVTQLPPPHPTRTTTMQTLGGKMFHAFKKTPNHLYTNEYTSNEAQEAVEQGQVFWKIDGSNGAMTLDAESKMPTLWRRYDCKPPKKSKRSQGWTKLDPDNLPDGYMNMPAGSANPSSYEGHHYFYRRIERPSTDDKSKSAAQTHRLYDVADKTIQDATLRKDLEERGILTLEMVGPSYNATPSVETDNIAFHYRQVCSEPFERNLEGIRTLMSERAVEGLVFLHKGRFWKVRGDGLGSAWKVEKRRWGKYRKGTRSTAQPGGDHGDEGGDWGSTVMVGSTTVARVSPTLAVA